MNVSVGSQESTTNNQVSNTRRVTRRANDENAVPTQAMARTKSAATSLGPPIKVIPPATAGKKAAAPGTKVVGAKRTALGGVVTNVNIKEEALEDKKPGKYSSTT
jgi:G2/mitotic-specific cyclin 1/2